MKTNLYKVLGRCVHVPEFEKFRKIFSVSLILFIGLSSVLNANLPTYFTNDTNVRKPDCPQPVFGHLYLMKGTCKAGIPDNNASVFFENNENVEYGIAQLITEEGGLDPSQREIRAMAYGGNLHFQNLIPSRKYKITVFGYNDACFSERIIQTLFNDCYGSDLIVDKEGSYMPPFEAMDGGRGVSCGTGTIIMAGCDGHSMPVNKSNLNSNRYIAAHGNCGTGSAILPACLAYVDENCNVFSEEYAFCFDYNKSSGLGAGYQPGTVQFIRQVGIQGIPVLNEVKAARLSWVFEHLDDYGLSLNNSTHRRALQLVSWKIINPEEPGVQEFNCENATLPRVCSGADNLPNWCAIYDAAMAAVPTGAQIPNLSMTPPSSSALISQTVTIQLTTNEDVIDFTVSDGGPMPYLCSGSQGQGHVLVDNNDGTGTLTLSGSGQRTVSLCFERAASVSLEFVAEIETRISDGSSFSIYMPQPPYENTVQPFFSYSGSVLRPRATVEIEFSGDLDLYCPDQLVLDCYNFDPADVTAWLATIEVEADCGVKSVTNNYNPDNFQGGACPQVGTQVVTFTVTDNCDQVKTCTATIIVNNNRQIEWISVPSDITIACNETIPVTSATAGDNCGVVTVTYNDENINQTCPNTYTVKRTFTAQDECGNTKAHIQHIHIVDNVNPVFVNVPADITVDCSQPGYTTQIQSWLSSVTATDNCSDVTITNNFNPAIACGEVSVTFVATDACGNNVSVQRKVTISGSQTPGITVGTTPVLNCGDSENLTLIQNWLNTATATNSCGNTDVTVNYTAQQILTNLQNGTFTPGETCQSSLVVTFTAQDPCGAPIQIQRTINLVDGIAPTISCPSDLTLECGNSNNQNLINSWLNMASGNDNCSNVVVTNDYNSSVFVPGCGNSGHRVVTFTATDNCGNQVTCSATIYIQDNTAPVFTTAPADVTIGCDQSVPAPAHVVTDNCGTVNVDIQESTVNGECAYDYKIVRTYTATDQCGNVKVHIQNIHVKDLNAPVFTYVPADYTAECGDELVYEDATATDNCGDVVVTVSVQEISGSCAANKTFRRTFTATDDCGNSTQAVQNIYVADSQKPVFTSVPQDVTLSCGDAIPTHLATASDACSQVTVTYTDATQNLGCAQSYVITRTFTATDACGNSEQAVQVITVLDEEKPYFTNVPEPLSLDCTNPGIATLVTSWLNQVTAADDCSSVTVSNNYVANYNCGLYNIMHIAADACGNRDTVFTQLSITGSGEFEIIIPTAPEVNCGDDHNLQLIRDWLNSVYAEGNCGQVQVISNKTAEDILLEMQGSLIDPKGECQLVIEVEFSASDLCGIAASKQGEITLVDSNPPVVNCPDTLVIECGDPDTDQIIQDWLNSIEVFDYCTNVIVEHTYDVNSFITLCGNTKTQSVIFFAHDECGNSSWCIAEIVIEDTTLPQFVNLPDDITISCEDQIPAYTVTATDNCGTAAVEVTESRVNGSCPHNFSLVRTYTATDQCGNQNIEIRTITVIDEQKPTFTFMPEDITFECNETIVKQNATATDQCSTPNITVTETVVELSCANNYTITRIFRATDACGNYADTTQTITVRDITPPTFINIPQTLNVSCDAPNISILIQNWINSVSATDLCGSVAITNDYAGSMDCGEYKVVFTATDACGNTAKDSSYIMITGSGELEIFVPEAPELNCGDEDNLIRIQNWLNSVYATGGCGEVQVIADKTAQEILIELEENLIDSKGECISVVEIEFSTSDLCGDAITYTADLSIFDTENPVISCPQDLIIDCGNPDLDDIIAAWLSSVTATDNCTDITIENNFSEEGYTWFCGQTREQEVLFLVYDACGNQSFCTARIIIEDTDGPVFTFVPGDYTVSCEDQIVYANALAIDDCGDVSITDSAQTTNGSCPYNYTITRTFIAEDECGNESYAYQTITVIDDEAPVFSNLPVDYTVSCADDLNVEILTAADNCGEAIVTYTVDTLRNLPGECAVSFALVVNYLAEDECGNQATHIQTISFIDNNPPVFSQTPDDLTVECDNIPVPGTITALDDCGEVDVVFSEDIIEGDCPNRYIIQRTWTASDECDNEAVYVQTITVVDRTIPVFVGVLPVDITVECEEIPEPAILTATDNCGIATVEFSQQVNGGSCSGSYTIVRSWVAEDECGNEAYHTQNIFVQSTSEPEFVGELPQDIIVECHNIPEIATLTAVNSCTSVDVTATETRINGDCPNRYVLVRVWTAEDDCENRTTHTQYITVIDTESPVFVGVLPVDITVECDAVPAAVVLTATDNCSDVSVIYSEARQDGNCPYNYVLVRTWAVTDECGNSTIHVQRVTVQDTESPVFVGVLPVDITVECNAVPSPAILTATDNCSDVNVQFSEARIDGNCAFNYQLVRTWTVTDECGNNTMHIQIVTVQETGIPEFGDNLPVDITVECDAVPEAPVLTATGTCSEVTIEFSEVRQDGNCPYNYVLVRTWTVTDECGNSTAHVQYVTVQDTEAPEFAEVLPVDITVECDAVPAAVVLTATDNCSDVSVIYSEVRQDGNCPYNYVLVRTWTVTDECGNSTAHVQYVTVQDTEAPEFAEVLPVDITVECDAVPTAVVLTATDNCSDVSVIYSEVRQDGNCPYNYVLVRTWTVTDECGNGTAHVQYVTVQDTEAPEFIEVLPVDITVECDAVPAAEVLTATDNCSEVSVIYSEARIDGNCPYNYVLVRTWTVTDECGNGTAHVQYVTVQDTEAPEFIEVLPVDITVECDAVPAAVVLTATDNCSEVSVIYSEARIDGNCPYNYVLVRTWTVTDECENSTAHVQYVTVQDTEAPEFVEVLPVDITVECDAVPLAVVLTATDNCSEVNVIYSEARIDGNCPYNYVLVRTWTVTDECENSTSHVQYVTVQDTEAPEFVEVLPVDITVECDAVPAAVILTATDNCSDVSVIYSEVRQDGNCPYNYVLVRTWTVTDECGNSTIHVQRVTVQDTTAPVIEVINPEYAPFANSVMIVECHASDVNWEVPDISISDLSVTDNCGDYTVQYEEEFHTSEDCKEDGYLMEWFKKWTFTDECGNSSDISFTVRIVDNTPPVILGVPNDTTVLCGFIPVQPTMSNCLGTELNPQIIAVDGCECATLELEELIVNQTCENSYDLLRIWTAIDNCGNVSTAQQVIRVRDNEGPRMIPVNSYLEGIESGSTLRLDCEDWGLPQWLTTVKAGSVVAIDGCAGEVNVSFNKATERGQCMTDGYFDRLVYSWTAADNCGNQSEYVFYVEVSDITAPIVTGPVSICSTDPELSGLTYTDGCSDIVYVGYDDKALNSGCNNGDILRTWQITDACSNSTFFEQIIHAGKKEGPAIIFDSELFDKLPSGSSVEIICGEDYRLDNYRTVVPRIIDNCDMENTLKFSERTIVQENCEGGAAKVVVFTWTATDYCGNTSQYVLNFRFIDERKPYFVGNPKSLVIECGANIPLPNAVDGCSSVKVNLVHQDTISQSSNSCINGLVVNQRYEAVDLCGNTAVFERELIVRDTKAPQFVNFKAAVCIEELTQPEVADACGGEVTLTYEDSQIHYGCVGEGYKNRTWTATDECGNSTQIQQIIYMEELNQDYLVLKHNYLGELRDGHIYEIECSKLSADLMDVFGENQVSVYGLTECIGVDINPSIRLGASNVSCAVNGYLDSYLVGYRIDLPCGDQKEIEVEIRVVDRSAPQFIFAPQDKTVYCDDTAIREDIIVSDCSDYHINYSEQITSFGIEGNDYELVRFWVVTDECGNKNEHKQTIYYISGDDLDGQIILLNIPTCNRSDNQATIDVVGGKGPYTYYWEVLSGDCVILGGQNTKTIDYRIGFSPVRLRVKVKDANGCIFIKEISFVCDQIRLSDRFEELGGDNESFVFLYPNPTRFELFVEWFANSKENVEMRIVSVAGQEVRKTFNVYQEKGFNKTTVDVREFVSGVYILEIREGDQVRLAKFIKIE